MGIVGICGVVGVDWYIGLVEFLGECGIGDEVWIFVVDGVCFGD